MRPPFRRLPAIRHFQVVEVLGSRQTPVGQPFTNRFLAHRLKKSLEGTTSGRLKVIEKWA